MLTRRCVTAAIGIALICASITTGQESRITLGVASSDRLQDDLKFLVELAPAPLDKQWKTLKDVLDSFVEGVDTTQPAQMEINFGAQELSYVAGVPVAKLTGRGGFVPNVQAFGFKVTGPDPVTGLYTAEQQRAAPRGPRAKRAEQPAAPVKPFFMKDVKGYMLMASNKAQLPASAGNPAAALKAMFPGEVDLVAALVNDAAGMAAKQKNFQSLRKQLEAGVEFHRGETQEAFNLRKLALQQHLAEAERFLTESSELKADWSTDASAKQGLGHLLLKALPGTSLAASIEQLVQTSSQFANVKFGTGASLQLRVNFAVDELRAKHAAEFYDAMLPVLQQQMDTRPNLNAGGKAAAKEALGKLFKMLHASIPLKVLDTIIDVHASTDGKNVGICAIKTADGTQATEILQLLPKIRDGWKVETGIATQGDITIHAVTVAPHRLEEFQSVFGGEPMVYIGVSKDAVWGAAGTGALDLLKAAIDQAAQPAPAQVAPEFLALEMRFEPWVKLLDVMRGNETPSTTTDEKEREAEKQRTRTRKHALASFAPGDDILKATLLKKSDTVAGEMEIQTGILRFLGTMIADFTAENLR